MKSTSNIDFTQAPRGRRSGSGWKHLRNGVAMGLCLLLLAACATSPAARDQLIQQRAQARWEALLTGDYAMAYSYASPGYRSSTSVADFEIDIRSRRIQYTSAEYREHSCEESVCIVQMQVGYKVIRPVPGLDEWEGSGAVEERWINRDGRWWFLPEK